MSTIFEFASNRIERLDGIARSRLILRIKGIPYMNTVRGLRFILLR